ncbi:4-(cytidine 5'-diphospho)-2-C-methyl-D-erythritol kinase [Phosphitispora sp. TUW77]|uniref:4-(cytidine 5'-diphospho)-2-C-methyl-D-erythritol kinase n=1 Tax=Phosphitispora sp. TUW77 TaxID=3152361 RepID=UPI003AB455EC
MRHLELKAAAKINLTLDVLGKLPDGYHEVEMVMQSIELHDVVVMEEAREGIEVFTNHPRLPGGRSNIAYKAALLIKESFGIKTGVRIHITKNIPLAAGLAGGSTDAAAVLRGLNCLWELGLSYEGLLAKAALIGSDVSFCIQGGTALAKGRGEVILPLHDVPELWMVLVKPPLDISTAEIYREYDPAKVNVRPDTGQMIFSIERGDKEGIAANLGNVLESVTLLKYPVVAQVKERLEKTGALRAIMSGSGPTVFGITNDREYALKITELLKKELEGMFVEVTRTLPGSSRN